MQTQSLGLLNLEALLCEVTRQGRSLGELTIWEAYFVRLALWVLKLGEANSERLTLCGLRPLRSFMLNLGKLCEANFAHRKCRRAYFAGLSL